MVCSISLSVALTQQPVYCSCPRNLALLASFQTMMQSCSSHLLSNVPKGHPEDEQWQRTKLVCGSQAPLPSADPNTRMDTVLTLDSVPASNTSGHLFQPQAENVEVEATPLPTSDTFKLNPTLVYCRQYQTLEQVFDGTVSCSALSMWRCFTLICSMLSHFCRFLLGSRQTAGTLKRAACGVCWVLTVCKQVCESTRVSSCGPQQQQETKHDRLSCHELLST